MHGAQLVAPGLQAFFHLHKQAVLAIGVFHIRRRMAVCYRKMLEHAGDLQPLQTKTGLQLVQAGGDVLLTTGDEAQPAHAGVDLQMAAHPGTCLQSRAAQGLGVFRAEHRLGQPVTGQSGRAGRVGVAQNQNLAGHAAAAQMQRLGQAAHGEPFGTRVR